MDIPKYPVWQGQMQIIESTVRGWPPQLKLLLGPINKEVEAHDKAFSPMAKRNVALAIQERIADFEKVWKKTYGLAPLANPLQDLRTAARDESAANISVHKYEYVSCIGYKVGTGKWDESVFRAAWDGTKYEAAGIVQYTGVQGDKVDSLIRRARMKEAIRAASQLYQTELSKWDLALSKRDKDQKEAKTLKIFMAPEFFFRGSKGAYDISVVSEIFTDLRGLTCDENFKDWLFVFGTVIAASFDDRLVCRTCGKSGAKSFQRVGVGQFVCAGCPPGSVTERRLGARIDNVALIQKGGEDTDKNSYVVEKEYVSHIDFRRHVTPHALKEGQKVTGYDNVAKLKDWDSDRRIDLAGQTVRALPPPGSRDVGGSPSKFTDERMGGSIFTVDGIKFGLEICLDHLNSKIGPGTGIQIQLVPSAGANLQQFACIPQGIAFNVDGGGDGTCDVRINDSGAAPDASATLTTTSSGVPSGGDVLVYKPHPIPYA